MNRVFVDANVFMRFLMEDEQRQADQAAGLFTAAAAGSLALVTGPAVLLEIGWTLRGTYRLSRETTLDVLTRIAGLPGLDLADASLVEEALRLARESGQEFADAYIAASARAGACDAVATFNRKHFEKLGTTLHEL